VSAGSAPHATPRAIGGGEQLTADQLRRARLRSIPRPSRLARPLSSLRGAGPKLAEAAAELGIESVGDLLAHVPREHRDHGEVVGLGDLRIGEQATVLVEVRSARKRPTRRRNLTIVEADVADVTGRAKAIWFNQAYLVTRLTPGTRLLLTGKLERGTFKVASHELVSGEGAGIHTVGVVPVHAASDRLRLSAQRIREWAKQAVEFAPDVVEPLPAGLRVRRALAGAADAIAEAHFPADLERAAVARRRLAYEELFLHQAALAQRRGRRGEGRRAPALAPPGVVEVDAPDGRQLQPPPVGLPERWVETLPFALTDDQRHAIEEIDADLARERPMQRLLMGEVGSGKTVIALHTMLRAVAAGSQAVLMAPTETRGT
jgi:ATP-dependent DNA helicase RecG